MTIKVGKAATEIDTDSTKTDSKGQPLADTIYTRVLRVGAE